MYKDEQQREAMEKLYNTPSNLRLKYAAIAFIAVTIAIFMVMIFWNAEISPRVYLFLRGCAGLCALVFAILLGILVYRVNSAYIKQRWSPKR